MRKSLKQFLAMGLMGMAAMASNDEVYMDKYPSASLGFKGSKEDLKKVFGMPKKKERAFTIKGVEINAVDKKTAIKIYNRKFKDKKKCL